MGRRLRRRDLGESCPLWERGSRKTAKEFTSRANRGKRRPEVREASSGKCDGVRSWGMASSGRSGSVAGARQGGRPPFRGGVGKAGRRPKRKRDARRGPPRSRVRGRRRAKRGGGGCRCTRLRVVEHPRTRNREMPTPPPAPARGSSPSRPLAYSVDFRSLATASSRQIAPLPGRSPPSKVQM